jgi:hypothetical protein
MIGEELALELKHDFDLVKFLLDLLVHRCDSDFSVDHA